MRYLILALTLAQPLAALPIITNGSFESPLLTTTENFSGAFAFSGWSGQAPSQGGNAGLVYGSNNGLTPAQGTQHFTFNGGNPSDRGWLEQAIATTPGTAYTLTFAVGRAGSGQDLSLTAAVLTGATPLTHQTFLPPPTAGYLFHTLDFIAPDTITTLRFTDTSGPNSISDLYLDAIELTPHEVPDNTSPSDLLLLLGAALLATRLRR